MATKSKTKEQQGSVYKANKQWEVNRKKRLERTIKNQPNNEQAKLALKGMVYRRKTPGNAGWSHSEIRVAKLFKLFGGYFDRSFFHVDPKVSQAFLQRQSPKAARTDKVNNFGEKSFFSILSRVSK